MGILASILGSGDVIKAGLNLIDDMHTSKVEEIEAKTEAKVRLIQAYEPYKLAQRYLALLFTFTFLGCFVLVLGMTLFGETDIDNVRSVISEFWIGEIMMVIVSFYYGGGVVESIKRKKK